MTHATPSGTETPTPPVELRGVVAAVDHALATRPVLAAAACLAACLDRPLTAVHVEQDASRRRAAEDLSAEAGIAVATLPGDPAEALAAVASLADVDVLVVGARGLPSSRHRLGRVTTAVLAQAGVPVLVVPPGTCAPRGDRTHRVLVPLDTDARCAAASRAVAERLQASGCEIVGLHVFEPDTVPRFLDHPGHGTTSWRGEFARRHGLADLRLRAGTPARRIAEQVVAEDADLVLLAWSGVLADRHGEVVRQVLSEAEVPVLVVPAAAPDEETRS